MVRLETGTIIIDLSANYKFTFQYGQIRNYYRAFAKMKFNQFTFQYGQIRNKNVVLPFQLHIEFTFQYGQIRNDLAIESKDTKIFVFTFQYGQIRNL